MALPHLLRRGEHADYAAANLGATFTVEGGEIGVDHLATQPGRHGALSRSEINGQLHSYLQAAGWFF